MSADRFRLDGTTALVTGAASGIGRATALLMAQLGAHVVAADVDAAGLDATIAQVQASGGRADAELADVTVAEQVARVVAHADRIGSGLSVLASVAGVVGLSNLAETDEAEFDRVLAVDLRGVFLCCRDAFTRMRDHGRGSIVNVTSSITARAVPGYGPYAVAKGGVATMTKALAVEGAAYGIRANAVAPGFTLTPMTMGRHEPDEALQAAASIAATIPLGRCGEPEDIAYAIAFLASEAAAFVTGQTLFVNGGTVMP
jgi:3-oxoacyl-[acyl-carrier protein] reductase